MRFFANYFFFVFGAALAGACFGFGVVGGKILTADDAEAPGEPIFSGSCWWTASDYNIKVKNKFKPRATWIADILANSISRSFAFAAAASACMAETDSSLCCSFNCNCSSLSALCSLHYLLRIICQI